MDNECITYYRNGMVHNDIGPAMIWPNGECCYYIDGELHREDGPAVDFDDYKEYWIHGKQHRLDGPALEYSDPDMEEDNEYYIDDIEYTKSEFLTFLRNQKIDKLINNK